MPRLQSPNPYLKRIQNDEDYNELVIEKNVWL